MTVFAGLALLPDADVALVALGTCDAGACGHRGASHSLPLALAIGLIAGYVAHRLRWPVVRTMVATTFAVASHALLDVLGAGGRGLPLLWPFTNERFMSPIRIFPDAPRGLALLSRPGVMNVAIEFAVFLPLMNYALWPRIAGWLAARAVGRAIPRLPRLTFTLGTLEGFLASREEVGQAKPDLPHAILEGTVTPASASASAAAPPAPAPAVSDDRDPPLLSAG
jgi:inner membrane protein